MMLSGAKFTSTNQMSIELFRVYLNMFSTDTSKQFIGEFL